MLTPEISVENRCRLLCTEIERYGDVGVDYPVAHAFGKSVGYDTLASFKAHPNGVLRFEDSKVILTRIGKEYLGRWR